MLPVLFNDFETLKNQIGSNQKKIILNYFLNLRQLDSFAASVISLCPKLFLKIDFIVHAIAYSDKNELTGRYIETTKENFLQSM